MPQPDERAEERGFEGRPLSTTALTLGEGPTYDPASETAWWFDIVGKKLVEYRFPDGTETIHSLPLMASMLATIDDRRQLVATEDGLYVRDRASGALEMRTPLEAENAITRSNDGRVHPSGALWIGTMGKKAEEKAGAIYWFRGGEIRLIFPQIGIPNAIAFSPDGDIAYFADTQADTIYRAELDRETGLPLGSPSIFLAPGHDDGGPDGAVVDAEGRLWCARWGGSAVSAYAPGGQKVASATLPASQATCPAFVGPNADRMIVTSAREGLSEDDLERQPQAGCTFLLDVPVRGRHEPRVML